MPSQKFGPMPPRDDGCARPKVDTSTVFRRIRRHFVGPATVRRGRIGYRGQLRSQAKLSKIIEANRPTKTVHRLTRPKRRSDRSLRRPAGVSMAQTYKTSALPADNQTSANGPGDESQKVAEELTALRAIVDAASSGSGEEYFQVLVRTLARVAETRWAFVAQFSSPETQTSARTIAFWDSDHFAENFEWTLAGTAWEEVVQGNLCHHASGVQQKFPDDPYPRAWGIESFLGVPLCDSEGTVLGHLAAFDEHPMPEEPRKLL